MEDWASKQTNSQHRHAGTAAVRTATGVAVTSAAAAAATTGAGTATCCVMKKALLQLTHSNALLSLKDGQRDRQCS